ncbi:hypothetical protein ACP4OV_020741 [Aristida adscensionis]
MPQPQRRRRHRHRPAAAMPYAKSRSQRQRQPQRSANDGAPPLPDDALAGVFARLPCAADVVRCAAACALWRRVVATRTAPLPRSLPPAGRFLPQLAVGAFHQESDCLAGRRRNAALGPQPRFVATAAGSRLLGSPPSCLGELLRRARAGMDGGLFDHSRPVASRSGRLVLELQRESRGGGVTLCVCNPLTGHAAVLPLLSGEDKPTDYGCALLTGDDLLPRRGASFFLLLLVYNRRRFTALRCYSSDTGRWGPETRSAVEVSSAELRHIGPAVVRRGVAFWPLDNGALGVRPAADPEQAMEVHLLPYGVPHYWPEKRLLGISPDGRLFFVYFAILAVYNILIAKISYFDIRGDDIGSGRKESSSNEEGIKMPEMTMATRDCTLKLRWAGEKSGMLLFTMGESSGHNGTFVLDLGERTVEKLAVGEGDSWRNLFGFEMDWAAYLASFAPSEEN